MSEVRYLTVSALTRYIKRKFDVDPHLQDIWIKGEISNFKKHSRGHMYFTLKDENARIAAVMFAGHNSKLAFQPEEGMKVLIRSEISVYEPSGNYQMYVKEMQPDGVGNLYLAYEQLKKKLEKEGLFHASHKQNLPKYPSAIGVITSPTGAAVRDIITTLKRRYPIAKIIVIPALVQGVNAAPSIVKAINEANKRDEVDVLIVGRGGGSIEELWAFNEEAVARAIYHSALPVISAVGHETDFTIADFVADLRAPTPTGAAELAVPSIAEISERISQRNIRLLRAMNEKIQHSKRRLEKSQKSYAFRYPQKLIEQKEQQLDRVIDTLYRESKRFFERKQNQYEQLAMNLQRNHPQQKIKQAREQHMQLTKVLQREMQQLMKQQHLLFATTASKLHALSPLKTMERGYSLVYDDDQKLIKSTKQLAKGDTIQVRLTDGQLQCEVSDIKER
ncbi:exodeoxyribonuclease VII large subunit [Priestia aryabhattai]|uniref:exodeoxyribonuclease VII large subunit n=1 Tax=Bacillaceae TaxID=186817 RepID=UPI000BA1152A|nr:MULTISPECIES: exodeoxyribonuclease VII large subunit [Bacillaceae]MDT2045518.1 exodeoxyribonuclease VII large subunit [Priestia flexa]OZT13426.1 exodeoxyribonuclease VII large subunit [Priestia aryabhattai]TDB50734.1 exodeoxyribonuclease VII large subunit [Bacillus sp. CBEL-1]USY54426.1 exodeoxyribonuclease VII large subunit [Bacillus sp. 1780r2a1]